MPEYICPAFIVQEMADAGFSHSPIRCISGNVGMRCTEGETGVFCAASSITGAICTGTGTTGVLCSGSSVSTDCMSGSEAVACRSVAIGSSKHEAEEESA